jgi:hypothetical protein
MPLTNVMVAEIPSPPLNPQVIYSSSTTINFGWTQPEDDGGSQIFDY